MVDPETVSEQQIGTSTTGTAQNLTTDPMLQKTIKNFKEIQQSILDDIKDPQIIISNTQRATIEDLLHELRTAISVSYSGKIQEIKEMKS